MLLSTATASPAARYGRMTVEIRIDGQQSWSAQQDHGRMRMSEHDRIVTQLLSDGQLNTVNELDPDLARKQIAKAAAVQRRVAQAQQRSGVVSSGASYDVGIGVDLRWRFEPDNGRH